MKSPMIGPFDEVARMAQQIMSENDNATVFQLFECCSCQKISQTFEPNTFNEFGVCPCGAKTDLRREGCGFLTVIGKPDEVASAAIDAAYGKPQGLPS